MSSKSKEERYLSRPHHKEEKKQQKWEWLKRRKEEKRRQKRLKKAHGKKKDDEETEKAVKKMRFELADDIVAQPDLHHAEIPVDQRQDLHQAEIPIDQKQGNQWRDSVPVLHKVKDFSRGKQMLTLAKLKNGKRTETASRQQMNHPEDKSTSRVTTVTHNQSANRRNSKLPVREINSSLVKKVSDKPIGSGTFGNFYLAEYRGMKTVLKEMKKRNASLKESERCKREVLHEARVILSLGDYPNFPFLFGACTEREPFFLVLQFHGKGDESVTLHKTVKKRMFNKHSTAQVFHEISETLNHIHNRGFLHNDLKTNNVIIQQDGEIFHPIIIDFGKSKETSKVEGYRRRINADYLAPEVKAGINESPESDMYSFGKMLEAAVSGRSFRASFSEVIASTTASAASDRPSACQISLKLAQFNFK